jgi:hypothetical protein
LLVLLAIALFSTPNTLAEQVTLQPVKDTTIYEDAEGSLSNGSGDYLFAGVNGITGGNRILRSVIAFDLSSIPAGARIENVTLQMLQETPRNDTTQREVSLHRVMSAWGEGASDADEGTGAGSGGADGAPAAEGDATWLHTFFSDTFWTSPGGDFDDTASASRPVGANNYYQWTSEQMAADLQGWLDDPSSNFGWLVKGQESLNGATTTAKRFSSRESTGENIRPQLYVDYSVVPRPEFVFPQFISGDGNSTRWIFLNNSESTATGHVAFVDASGDSIQVSFDGAFTDRLLFSIDPWGSLDVSTDSTGPLKAGAAEVYVDSGSASDLEAAEVFLVLGNYVSVTGARPEKHWQAYVSRNPVENSGIAVQNPDRTSAAVLKLTLLNSSGEEVATDELTLQPGQRIAEFLGEALLFQSYFEENPDDFAGTLNVEVTAGEDVALVGLIQKTQGGALISVTANNNPYVAEVP